MTIADFVLTSDLDDFKAGDAEAIVQQVQSAIRSYCGWHVAPSIDETLVLDGRGSRHLWMPSLYVTDVTIVVDEGTTLTSDDYDWSASGYLERRNGCWSKRPRQVSVTLEHGYEDIPADLIGVAVAVAARSNVSPTGAVRQATGPFSLDFGSFNGVAGGVALLEHEKAILDRYKLPPRP